MTFKRHLNCFSNQTPQLINTASNSCPTPTDSAVIQHIKSRSRRRSSPFRPQWRQEPSRETILVQGLCLHQLTRRRDPSPYLHGHEGRSLHHLGLSSSTWESLNSRDHRHQAHEQETLVGMSETSSPKSNYSLSPCIKITRFKHTQILCSVISGTKSINSYETNLSLRIKVRYSHHLSPSMMSHHLSLRVPPSQASTGRPVTCEQRRWPR